MKTRSKEQRADRSEKRDSSTLGFVVDPLYGKLNIVRIGDAGGHRQAFLVKGERFGPDWREESELTSVHLTKLGRKKAELIVESL